MQTSYIYSVSRTNALSDSLLNKTEIERLLVAAPGQDLQSALKETYLAPYVLRVPNEDFELAVELTLIDAKRLIHRIAPVGDLFRVLWIQYDIHNLRVFAKATAQQLSFDELKPLLSERGVYNCAELHAAAENGTLDFLQSGWQVAYDQAVQHVQAGEIVKVDSLFDVLYFSTSKAITAKIGDVFMQAYLSAMIDLYNLKVRLRLLQNDSFVYQPMFISGGSISDDRLDSREAVLALFARFGGVDYWKEAIGYYEKTNNTTSLDARIDEYLVLLAKEGSYDMFTSASLVLYYQKCRQAAANIRTIVVGKNSGMKESAIRKNLRMAYVNE
jgi:vacuolar-type H+-ATPase subunit C/Vma6